MKEKQSLTGQVAPRYRKAGKKEKGTILDEFVHTTGYTRKYASWILRMWGKKRYVRIDGELVELIVGKPKKRKRKKRECIYDEAVFKALKKVWYMFDCLCGKRLARVLRSMLPILYKFGEIDFNDEVRGKLERISPATIDRLLKAEKKKLRIKGRSYTKPGTLLKHQIPIRTFDGWDEKKPGYVEVDLVGHDGGNPSGDFSFTLNVTDVYSGWTEPVAIKNKAQKWTFEALMQVQQRFPVQMLGIDSDNGGEFINYHLLDYCNTHDITFTRSRPYRKNDNCFVEQKNNSIVRRYAGYFRYDSDEQLSLLNEIYERARLLINFYYPSQKLISKHRSGSTVRRRHDDATTAHQRLIASADVPQITKQKLNLQFNEHNPAELYRQMVRLIDKLTKMTISMNGISEEAAG